MLNFRKLNKTQIKAVADLLLEMGKWLLLSIVFSSFFAATGKPLSTGEIAVASFLAALLIVIAIRLLKYCGMKSRGNFNCI
jgi:hypothetical protein